MLHLDQECSYKQLHVTSLPRTEVYYNVTKPFRMRPRLWLLETACAQRNKDIQSTLLSISF